MTVRDELVRVIATASDGYSDPDDHYAARFLSDHGPALVQALEDAERYRSLMRVMDEVTVKCGALTMSLRPAPYAHVLLSAFIKGALEVTDGEASRPVPPNQYAACSICFGNGFDLAGKPCPFAPHQAFDNKGCRT